MKIFKYLVVIFSIAIFCFGNAHSVFAASFQGLGDLAGKGFSSEAFDISGDGKLVVGRSSSFRNGREAFIWNQKDGIKALGQIEGSSFFSQNIKISKDGSKVIGDASPLSNFTEKHRCFIWDKEDGIRPLNYITDEQFICMDLSDDGSVIVGYHFLPDERREALFWSSKKDSIQTLGQPVNSNLELDSFYSKAMGVSADGKTIVGFMGDRDNKKAFVWTKSNRLQDIGDLEGGNGSSLAWNVSADGSTVVGMSSSNNGANEAFIWDEDNGMRGLGDIKGGDFSSHARDVSKNGSIVVGKGHSGFNLAFIWDQDNGIRYLESVLTNDYELDLKKWILISASGISDDGKTIVGWGRNPDGKFEAWIANLDQ